MNRLAVFLLAALFGLNLDLFLFETGRVPVPPFFLIGGLVLFALVAGSRPDTIARSALWRLLAAYAILAMFGFTGEGQDARAWQAVKDTVVALAYVSAWLLLLRQPDRQRCAAAGLGAALLVACVLNVYEITNPMTWSDVDGRSAGTFFNPNLASLAMLAAAAVLATRVQSNRVCALILAVAGVGILATFSRTGVALWAVLCLYCVFFSRRFRPAGALLVLTVSATALVSAFLLLPEEILDVPTVAQRIEVLQGRGFSDASSTWRGTLLDRALVMIQERPLLGHGPAAASDIQVGPSALGTHNEFLAVGVNAGLLGLGVFLAYLCGLLRRRAIAVLIVVAGAALSFHSLMLNRQLLLALALYESQAASATERAG